MEFQVLRVYHYGEDSSEDRRITIAPSKIVVVAACPEDTVINGRSLVTVSIVEDSGNSFELNINHADLETLERAVGSYFLG